uniref:Uncharacterized protein n=1 Tax=Amphimedon queenslandica TaxID=400682 RepID=A0A1X7VKW8_AMPQE
MTINVHSLLHLPNAVRQLGPLWAHSCFPYESENGEFFSLFHRSQSIEKQVVNYCSVIQKLPSLANSTLVPGSELHDEYIKMA